MRAPLVALSALVLGLGVVGGTAAPAFAHDPSADSSATPSSDMMSMGDDASNKDDRASAVRRAKQKPVFLEASLSGANEVPVAGGPAVGDPDGKATGLVRVQGDRVTFAFSWKGISAPTLGHIHQGAAGANGAVKVPLFGSAMPDSVDAAAGVVTVTDAAVADALRDNPSNFYLNLHTKEFPGGAVRGQLTPLNNKHADLLDLLQGGGIKAFLCGDQEVPVAGGPAVGDPDGQAVAFIRAQDTQVGYSMAWLRVAPTLGHIHKAPNGKNGPVAVALFGTAVPSTIFAISGTVTGLDPALVRDIKDHPSEYYANLHSAEFPGGAVRGQLFSRH